MKLISPRILAVAGVLALGAVGTAQARVNVGIGLNLGGPVYAPAPVYAAPAYVAPAYVAPPAPVAYGYGYAAPQPVYVAPPTVYVAPAPAVSVYYGPGYGHGWHRGHYRHWR